MAEYSATRLYIGNIPQSANKADIQAHFEQQCTGEIVDLKLMSGFGFIEYRDPEDAKDVVSAYHGTEFMGERLTVQFARSSRGRENTLGLHERIPPRPRRTAHRMQIMGLPSDTSWQDLKDFARQSSLDVVFSETPREFPGRGFVEFESAADLRTAVEKLDGREFKPGNRVVCTADDQSDAIPYANDRARSRSPRRSYAPVGGEDHDHRRPHPRAFSPRRNGYRDDPRARSPPRREYYDDRARYRSPPRRVVDDFQHRRDGGGGGGRYDEVVYRRDYAPPGAPVLEPYGGAPRQFHRPPTRDPAPNRDGRTYPPREDGYHHAPRDVGYSRDYDRGHYW